MSFLKRKLVWIPLAAIGVVVMLAIIGAIVGGESSIPAGVVAPNQGGRAYMHSQPCVDVLAEYNAMKVVGHDAALTHVSNVYNTKTGARPYIAVSDARARVDQCLP